MTSRRFKDHDQQQNWLFPPSIEELIPQDHPVRIVNGVIEHLYIQPLIKAYSKDGRPSYHPKMMLKVMVYAYMDNTCSSRKIEKAMRENINFMWLSNEQVADHNTIARFRSNKLKGAFKDIFKQVVLLLAEEGLVTLKGVYTDGAKGRIYRRALHFCLGQCDKDAQGENGEAARRDVGICAEYCR